MFSLPNRANVFTILASALDLVLISPKPFQAWAVNISKFNP